MKRAVLCVSNPWDFYDQLQDWSVMTVNPDNTPARQKYLLDHSDWSIKITVDGVEYRDGGNYQNERIFAYTSGTTGDSKFYSFSQSQIDHCIDHMIRSYEITANDRYVGIMPLWHAHGQAFYWLTKKIKCETHFMSVAGLRNMSDYHPTFVTAVPDILKAMSQLNFDSLRFIRSASSAMPDWLYKNLQQRFGVPVIEAFGMTEAYSHCFTNPLHGEQRMGTVGLPNGIEATISDNGHLLIRGPSVVSNDWVDTGDLAEQDSAGYYRILGRSVDQLNIKGKKFNPVSLESQLLQHLPETKQCVIFGDRTLNCLYVGDCEPNEIQQFLLSLDPHLRLALLEKVEEIPTKHSGKISRSYLRTLYNCQ
jgi:long-subunit acyl-CoA synthetase (AMP-forming)